MSGEPFAYLFNGKIIKLTSKNEFISIFSLPLGRKLSPFLATFGLKIMIFKKN
jgi:hypothetical protein